MTKISWFKLMWLNSEEREALRKGLEAKEKAVETPKAQEVVEMGLDRPYRSIFYSNGTATVVLKDGTTLSQANVSRDLVIKVSGAKTEDEIHYLLFGTVTEPVAKVDPLETEEEVRQVRDNLDVVRDHPEFEVSGQEVFMKGVKLPIPSMILATFIEILEKLEPFRDNSLMSEEEEELTDAFVALKMFWLKLALSPLPQCREDLLRFVKQNDVRITKNGNLVLYRRVVSIEGADNFIAEQISLAYARIKKMKKGPKNFLLVEDEEGVKTVELSKASKIVNKDSGVKVLGNVYDLYKQLSSQDGNKFTSWHNRGRHTIQLGSIYKIDDKEINLNNGLCAAGGLHAASVDYNYSSFGDTPVVVLVNPSKAITVPTGEIGKLRTTEMFVACVNDKDHGVHFDEGALSSFDEEYHDRTLEELQQIVDTKDFTPVKVEGKAPQIEIQDVVNIKKALEDRIQTIA